MPPPMPNPAKRMTAQPSRPVQRYRPGKAVAEDESDDEEESEEEEQQQQSRPVQRLPQRRPQAQQEEDEDEDDEDDGFVTDPEDDEGGGVQVPAQKTTAQTTKPAAQSRIQSQLIGADPEDENSQDKSEDGSESESDSSSEEDSSSSDEEPRRKFQRPTFIKKSERTNSTPAVPNPSTTSITPDPTTPNPDSKARRVAEADILLREKLERDALARAAGRRAWDDDDENLDPSALIDDTDDLDPPAEHAAWRLRELHRLKRDREALTAREAEIGEIERRRNLTSAEREAEDKVFIRAQTDSKDENRGPAAYMTRYHHKGAFFQDDEEARELLASRDIMGARFEDEVGDKSLLPEFMRIRDMTKLGKKGRSKYRDLKAEDTGRFGDDDRRKRWDGSLKEGAGGGGGGGGAGEGTFRGVDPRFLPDDDRGFGGGRGPTASGANASALGRRRSRSRSPRRRDQGDSYKSRRRSHSRSRSRSPARRKRSPSPYRDRDRDRDRDWDRDKRRRIDAL